MEKSDFIEWVRKLQDGYEPSEETRAHLAQVDLVAIVGPTGVGKSAIINKLSAPSVIGDVTRVPREGEKNGINYLFRDDYLDIISDIKKGDYVQFYVSGSDEFYGTRSLSYVDDGACSMAVIARAVPFFRTLGYRSVKAFYIMPPSYKEWMRRLSIEGRADLLPRIDEARESVTLAANNPDDFTFILNDDIDRAVADIEAALKNEPIDEHRLQLAEDTANIILEYIGDEDTISI